MIRHVAPVSARPMTPRPDHGAGRAADCDATSRQCREVGTLSHRRRREDSNGQDVRLGHPIGRENPPILTMPHFRGGGDLLDSAPVATLASFDHLDVKLPTNDGRDENAPRAASARPLALPTRARPDPIGHPCMVEDPDMDLVELPDDRRPYANPRDLPR